MTAPRYMLDTNIVSDIIRNPAGKSAGRLRKVGDHGLAVSIIAAAELRFDAVKSGSARLQRRLVAFLQTVDVLPFEAPADSVRQHPS